MFDSFSSDLHGFDMMNADLDEFYPVNSDTDGFNSMDSDMDGFSAFTATTNGFNAVSEHEDQHEPMVAAAHAARAAHADGTATVQSPGRVLSVSAQMCSAHVPSLHVLECRPQDRTLCSRSTFYVKANWPSQQAATRMVGQMYVEELEPLITTHPLPIILIHGDFHTGQIWMSKPDGKPGWASFFTYQGYRVFVVDLPACGRSGLAVDGKAQMASQQATLSAVQVERELTAPAHQEEEGWTTAALHTQWPGTGMRGDAAFDSYCASLAPLALKKEERQTLAQAALGELLERTGRAVLVGEGTGATMAWLAADAKPHLAAGVVAVEPAGPPCGRASTQGADGVRRYSTHLRPVPGLRPYGLADIPLTYDPPVDESALQGRGFCLLQPAQAGAQHSQAGAQHPQAGAQHPQAATGPRQLVNLRRMRHAVVTGQASSHSVYDWATVQFLQHAGVTVDRLQLEQYNIRGNGHLMYLESNSDQVASLVAAWIGLNVERSCW